MPRPFLHDRSAMALLIVLMLSTVMLTTALVLYRSGREYRFQMTKSVGELQSQFLAIGALQHAELKVRLFPTELYDAAMYSQGKNPAFDFSELTAIEWGALNSFRVGEYAPSAPYIHRAGKYNPGPRFVSDGTLLTDPVNKWYKLSSLDPGDTGVRNSSWFPAGWPKEEDGSEVLNTDLYLWKFRSDLNNNPAFQTPLSWNDTVATNSNVLDISTDNALPYKGSYEIISLKVTSISGQRRFNQEAIRMIAVSSIIDFHGFSHDYRIEKSVKVSRR